MGYSKSPKTVFGRLELLGPLMQGESVSWTCERGQEDTIAYQVRECLYISRLHPDVFPGLKRASDTLVVQVEGEGKVVTRLKKANPKTTISVEKSDNEIREDSDGAPAKELAIKGPQTPATVVQAWIDNKGKAKLHFPEAELGAEDLTKIYQWASVNEVLMFWIHPKLSLCVATEELSPYAFNPSEDLP